MKIREVINPFRALLLDEARLSTEFKIGFELEGICVNDELTSGRTGLPSYHSGSRPTDNAKKLLDILNEKLGLGEGHIESDSSVYSVGTQHTASGHEYTDRPDGGDTWGFEYVSPIIPFNPTNISKMLNFLKSLKDIGVVTNNHCGFHTHISYPDMDKESIGWVIFSIANDEKLYNEVTELDMGEYKINFFSDYAKKNNLVKAKELGDSLKNDNKYATKYIDNEKYEVLRVHPQGTLEWRGPRNFINDGSAIKEIEGYIRKLYKLIVSIGDILGRNEYNGFNRKEIADHLKIEGTFDTEIEKKKMSKSENITRSFIQKPSKIFNLSPSSMRKILTSEVLEKLSSNGSFLTVLRDSIRNNLEFNKQQCKTLIDLLFDNLNSNRAASFIDSWFSGYDKACDEVSEYLFKKVLDKWSGADIKYFANNIGSKLIIKDPELLKQIVNLYIVDPDTRGYLRIISNNEKYLDINAYMTIARRNPSILRKFNNVPKKVQRVITKRNPYAIQYINNPDPSVVDELLKKNPEIKDYILEKV